MEKFFKIAGWMLAMVVLFGLPACQNDVTEDLSSLKSASSKLKKADMNVFYSAAQPLGKGVVKAWVQVDKMGDPMALGVNLSAKALMDLPDEIVQMVFELPKTKGHHFYTHALVDWNPHGHEPPGVYDVPHFDFHFYTISNEERMYIPFMDPETYMDPAPESTYIPDNYMQLPGLVPAMGAHWVDLTSPELSGAPFTYTFIWGSYNGHYVFWEPMITLDYFMTMPDVTIPITQPTAFEMSGWYATEYMIKYSEKPDMYTVALTNLTYHEGQ